MYKKTNEEFTVELFSVRDSYGLSGFTLRTLNKATNEIIPINGDFNEIILNIENKEYSLESDYNKTIEVYVENNFNKLDVVDLNGEKRLIKDVYSDRIILFSPFMNSYSAGSIIKKVGNSGIYIKSLSIPKSGSYTLLIQNESENIFLQYSVNIIDFDIKDAKEKIDSLESEIKEASDDIDYVAFA